jgi:uncharacterized protein YggE
MTSKLPCALTVAGLAAVLVLTPVAARQAAPPQPPSGTQQPAEIALSITGEAGAPPRFAVPDFLAVSADAETQAAAKTIAQVLWDDFDFVRFRTCRSTAGASSGPTAW